MKGGIPVGDFDGSDSMPRADDCDTRKHPKFTPFDRPQGPYPRAASRCPHEAQTLNSTVQGFDFAGKRSEPMAPCQAALQSLAPPRRAISRTRHLSDGGKR